MHAKIELKNYIINNVDKSQKNKKTVDYIIKNFNAGFGKSAYTLCKKSRR